MSERSNGDVTWLGWILAAFLLGLMFYLFGWPELCNL